MFFAIPIDSPSNGTMGILSDTSILPLEIFDTWPTVIEVFRESISSSLGLMSSTFWCCSVPRILSKSVYLIFILSLMSGNEFLCDAMLPDIVSAFVRFGSSPVSIAKEPPGPLSVT